MRLMLKLTCVSLYVSSDVGSYRNDTLGRAAFAVNLEVVVLVGLQASGNGQVAKRPENVPIIKEQRVFKKSLKKLKSI